MSLEPGRYEITGTIIPITPPPAPPSRLSGYAYRAVIGLVLLVALWLLGQGAHGTTPVNTPASTPPAHSTDARPGSQEAHT